MRVQEVRGMQATLAEKLVAKGIKTADDLLKAGKTPAPARNWRRRSVWMKSRCWSC